MSTSDNLKFSTMVEDTQLAEDYLKNINYEVYSSQCYGQRYVEDYKKDRKNNKVYFIKGCDSGVQLNEIKKITSKFKSLANLADKLEENSELLAQLDCLIRNRAQDDTKKYDIRLISNCLRSFKDTPEFTSCVEDVYFKKNMAMACLLSVVHHLQDGKVVYLCPDLDVAVVAELFTNLCQSVGLPVFVSFCEKDAIEVYFVNDPRCAGVITEYSDRESAIDALISSTSTHCPWKLSRLLIQESCYEECKGIFCSKTKCVIMTGEKCTTRLEVDGKQFVFDYVGAPEDITNEVVLVEPYRTTKELLSLLTKYQPMFATVWSSYISEANEIAYQSQVPYVWINETCNFDYDNSLAQSIQQSLVNSSYVMYISDSMKLKSDNWIKLDFQARKKILKSSFKTENQDVFKEIDRYEMKQEVEVTNNRICIGITKPAKYVFLNYLDLCNITFLPFLWAIINGTTMIFNCNSTQSDFLALKGLNIDDLPIVNSCEDGSGSKQSIQYIDNAYVTEKKWVITSYGTKFAN